MVYAFNWYNVGAVLPLLGHDLPATTFQLGIVLGAFLVGAGIFQIPAGLAALRWGNRSVSIFALALMGAFSLASAFAPNWMVLAGLRFGAGAGAAFFFAPALGLVTSYYPHGSRGPIIGGYNAGFSVGSGIGLFGGAFAGAAFGWPSALLIGGVALLVMAAVAPLLLPKSEPAPSVRGSRALTDSALPVFRSRPVWALAIATSGLWGGLYVAAQYFLAFASSVHPEWSLAVAAAIPTVMILVEIPGGPIGGWLGERAGEMRAPLAAWGAACGCVILLVPFLPLVVLVPLFAFLGFADGVIFAILYLLPTYFPEVRGPTLALGLALINSIQIFLGSAIAVAFGYLAGAFGFTVAWVFAGVASLAPLPVLSLVGSRRGAVATPAVPRPAAGVAVRAPHRPG